MNSKPNSKMKFLCLLLPALVFFQAGYTQTVSGKVTAKDDQAALPGITVKVKDRKQTAVTGGAGWYTIKAANGDVLQFSGIGFRTMEVTVTAEKTDVQLERDVKVLNEVVVTALGIKKETRKLGYAVQEVKGADLVKAREPNAVNALTGKVAGLTVGISAELLAAPAFILRGSDPRRGQSPIFVVDGIPINSDTWNISADDIESFTVLKGPAASALYGYRGQNGAIIINTKKGSRDKRGFSIEFNSSTMFEKGFNAIPKVQDEYGPGDHGKYAFVDGRGGGLNDGDYDIWGPKFEGQLIPQYDSPVDPVTGVRKGTPWVARGKDNLKRFLQAGILASNNIAVSSSTEKSDLRFSVTHTYQRGMVPNTRLNMTNFNISNAIRFSNRVKLESNINYSRQFTPNIPDVVYGPNSVIYNMTIWGGADWNIDDMKNYWQPGKEGVQSIYAEYQRYHNPYFMSYEWLRGHYKNDLYGYSALSVKLLDNLELTARTGVTTYDVLRSEKMPFSAHPYGREEGKGDYREDRRSLFENNSDVLISYANNRLLKGLDMKISAGGNLRTFRYNSSFATTDYLNVPGVYNFANSRNPVKLYNFDSKMQVQSAYYSADFGYKDFVNLAVTGRWDKLSTLPNGKNTYFYPSASVSTVLSEYIPLPAAISFLKLKGSAANVKGGLTSPNIGPAAYPIGYGTPYVTSYEGPTYENTAAYNTPLVYNNQPAAYYSNTINNPGLKPFSRTNYEAGLDIRFLKNRIGLDVTYFVYKDGPGIFQRDVSEATGYVKEIVNGIETRRTGWEVSVNAQVLKPASAAGLKWEVMANWSAYREKLAGIFPGVNALASNFFIGDNRGNRLVQVGDRVDAIYGSAFARTQDGQLINDAGGRPIVLPRGQLLGYANPDWVWAINNRFSWKSFNLSFQFDGRVGGEMVNYIQRQNYRGGRNLETVKGKMGEARYQDYLGNKSWVGNGVVVSNGVAIQYDANGQITNYSALQFAPNTIKTFLQDYISRYYAQEEANIVSKTFGKLREITLGYRIPEKLVTKTPFRQVNISMVARNLLYFSKVKDIDLDQYPGMSAYSTLQTPTTKRYGININITF
ncbi:MAG: SusC/RagA family TonB-linked outer membrane protein [Dinghuibacter sp.]|nr:SusC/RagA family TonB-linked outer membrane protein [Dinghuibacter sp.]